MPGGDELLAFTPAARSWPWVFLPIRGITSASSFILLVLPTNGGDSVPRIEFLRSTLTGGLDAEARFPSGPRFQMVSDVSAIPLGRIAPSSWEVCSRLGEVYLRPSFFRWYRGKEDSCRVLALRSCVPLANA
jgi:hypothetical protein